MRDVGEPRIVRAAVELHDVVIDVARLVGGERTGGVRVRIDRAEGIDARQHRARVAIKLDQRAAEAWDPEGGGGEGAVIDRLPARTIFVGGEGDRLPVAGELPLLHELTVDPAVFTLAPGQIG